MSAIFSRFTKKRSDSNVSDNSRNANPLNNVSHASGGTGAIAYIESKQSQTA